MQRVHAPEQRRLPKGDPQRGASLLGVLVAVAIFGVLVAATNTSVGRAASGNKHHELRGEVDDLRANLRSAIGCRETFKTGAASVCGSGRYITVMARTDSTGKTAPLVGKTATPWQATNLVVRAWCGPERAIIPTSTSSKRRLLIQVNRLKADGAPKADPLTGKLMDGAAADPEDDATKGWNLDLYKGVDICAL